MFYTFILHLQFVSFILSFRYKFIFTIILYIKTWERGLTATIYRDSVLVSSSFIKKNTKYTNTDRKDKLTNDLIR